MNHGISGIFSDRRLNRIIPFLLLFSTGSMANAAWNYENFKSGVDEVEHLTATALSESSLSLSFPYAGNNVPQLIFRTSPKKLDVIFRIPKGQLICFQSCRVKIKIDAKPSRIIEMLPPADTGVRNLLFVSDDRTARALAQELSTAQTLAVELPIYGALGTVVKYDVSGLDAAKINIIPTVTPKPNSAATQPSMPKARNNSVSGDPSNGAGSK